ncbi:MAG: hypothetical protein JSR81_08645 [Proteobacteria bacterium]|nr:hypothetical protein [Pseudomonadota bacterium]
MTDDLDDLDALLSRPLPAVADDGFSAAVARRALQEMERHKLLDQAVLLLTGAIILAALPLTHLMAAIETVTLRLGNAYPVALAFAALVLTLAFMRGVIDRVE